MVAGVEREYQKGACLTTGMYHFFISLYRPFATSIKMELHFCQITLDPHGPNELRCNGPLSNMPEFHDAFNIQPGDPMYKSPEDRVDIW
jgi:putative endopeptidase